MRKASMRASLSVLVLAGAAFVYGPPAMADIPDTLVETVGGVVNGDDCDVGAGVPFRVAEEIVGTGLIQCDEPARELMLLVCVESSWNGQEDTWAVVGACGFEQNANQSNLHASGNGTCSPIAMYYRTRTVGRGVTASGRAFTDTVHSNYMVRGCPL
jgi:hypothetical protein